MKRAISRFLRTRGREIRETRFPKFISCTEDDVGKFFIQNEVQPFLCAMAARNGAPIDLSPVLAMSVSNVICSTIMGTRVQSCDSYFKRFMSMIDEGFKLFGEVVYVNYIPAMRHLSYMQSVRNKIAENHTEMRGFFRKIIDQHKETFDEENMRDLVDNYLVEIKHAKEEGRDNALYQGKDHSKYRYPINFIKRVASRNVALDRDTFPRTSRSFVI